MTQIQIFAIFILTFYTSEALMSATNFTRTRDYSDDANANAGGRDTINTAGLDQEMDDAAAAVNDHADKLDLLLRDDLLMQDNILKGHEFSSTALAVLQASFGVNGYLNERGAWTTATVYEPGDLVAESGNSYLCLVAHTSGVFATDLAAGKWRVFAAGAALSVGTPVLDYVLSHDGVNYDWRQVTQTEAPTLATVANPTFTGVVGMPDVNFAGRFNMTVETVTFAAGGNTFNFDTQFAKKVAVTGNYTGACSASNITQGDVMEVHFHNTTGSPAALLWDANWVWMGYKPASLAAGKKAVLSLRAIYGSTAADVVALWSVQP